VAAVILVVAVVITETYKQPTARYTIIAIHFFTPWCSGIVSSRNSSVCESAVSLKADRMAVLGVVVVPYLASYPWLGTIVSKIMDMCYANLFTPLPLPNLP
jgi:hypothetical protein